MRSWLPASLLPLLLPLLLLFSCKTKDLEYLSFDNLKVTKLGFPTTYVNVEVTCYNPNRFGGKLESLESDVFFEDAFLGKARIDSAIQVPKKDTFQIPVNLEVKTGATLNKLIQVLGTASDTTKLGIRLEGNARMRKSGIVVNYPIKYDGRKQ